MVKVSVIIPIYNTKEYLAESLDCIINQTLEDIEIICVNDGSTDGSEIIAHEYADKHSNIILINQENAGQSAARNAALQVASGKYIYCMDSDDIFIATALEELWEISEREQLDVLYFSGNTFYENQKLETKRTDFYERYLRKGVYAEVLSGVDMLVAQRQNQDYIVSTCLQFIRRSFLDEQNIRFYNGIIHEDNLFGFSVLMRAKRTKCINEIYFYRRVREESVMTKKETCANLSGYYTCLVQQIKVASELECTEEQRECVLGVLRGLLYHVKRLYFTVEPDEKKKFYERCNPWERYLFEAIIVTDLEEIARLRRVPLKGTEAIPGTSKNEYDYMQSSFSYKVGRIITFIPRKVRTCCRILKTRGIQGVIQVIKEKRYFG